MLKRDRIQILVEVDTDPVPGWGYDPNDYVRHIQHHLNQTIPHYNPVVILNTTEGLLRIERKRYKEHDSPDLQG
jgi:hypothetical protein